MPIEVEIKARIPDHPRHLAERAKPVASTYRDTYYDTPDGVLDGDGQELRVRVVELATGELTTVLTHKGSRIDDAAQPEHEATVADADAIAAVLGGLGYVPVLAFEKRCVNYRFRHHERDITVTVVQVPEIGEDTFVEIETIAVDDAEIPDATTTIHSVLTDLLSLDDNALTDETYTGAVRRHRAQGQ